MVLASVVALILLAAAEIYVIVVVAHLIGVALTVAALFASSVAGLWLVRIQGRRAWQALRETVGDGGLPGRELGDAALIFAGGALIAVPGFVTDALGLCVVAPLTRPVVRRILGILLLRRAAYVRRAAYIRRPRQRRARAAPTGKIIQGQVIETGPDQAGTREQPLRDDTPGV